MQTSEKNEIDLYEMWLILWKAKTSIIVSTLLFAIVGVFYALSLPNKYIANSLVISQNQEGEGSLAAMAGQLGGLANLAGINLGGGSDDTLVNIERIKSKEFIFKLINKHDVKVPLIAGAQWDVETGKLQIDDKKYSVSEQKWIREPEPNKSVTPSDQEAYELFLESLSINQDKVTGVINIEYEFISPVLAKKWVDLIVEEINQTLRQEKIAESKRSIEFLELQLQKTNVAEMKRVFYNLIEEQTKSMLLAEVQEDYAFKVIDPAVVPEKKSSPKRATMCIIIAFMGGVLSVIGCLLVHFVRKLKNEAE